MAVSKKLRFEVFKRDRFTCQYCGKRPPGVILEADHIVPKKDGGQDTIANLTTSCFECNRGKGANGLGDVAPALDELEVLASVQEMLERKRALTQEVRAASQLRKAEKSAIALVHDCWVEEFGEDDADGVFDENSVRMFLRSLSVDDVRSAVSRASLQLDRKPYSSPLGIWKYFCGICWNMIREDET